MRERFTRLCNNIKFSIIEFRHKCRVAVKRPYMLKAVLIHRCPRCNAWFKHTRIERQATQYDDDLSNWFCGCRYCREENDAYWESMWEDFYSSRL